MSKKLKHSKIKNTGVLFEVLTRQITSDILSNKESKSVNLVKKYFNKNTSLGKELELYEILTKERYNSEERANRLVDAVLKERAQITNTSLRREKYNLIKEIKEDYDVKKLFTSKIPNFKQLASIWKLFSIETSMESYSPKEEVDSRYTIVENLISSNPNKKVSKSPVTSEEKDVRLLAYELMVEKFNKKYSKLSTEQKEVLRKYINNVSNATSLKEFVQVEVGKIKSYLKKLVPAIDDDITKIKLTEAINFADTINENKDTEKKLTTLMRYYDLITELEDVLDSGK